MRRLKTINKAVADFKILIDDSIKKGGDAGKTAMIRSSKPILNLHEAIKSELIVNGINKELIYPPVNKRSPELKLSGALKQKNQDICVVPNNLHKISERLNTGLLLDKVDEFGKKFTEKTLVINIRSQISSIQKNFDTLYERTASEAQNLHDRCPKMCMGEVYMIAIPEYNDEEFRNNIIAFKTISQAVVEKYIKSFSAINNRKDIKKEFYKYESVCLLVVDFNRKNPKIFNSTEELIRNGYLPSNTNVDYDELSFNTFIPSLLERYDSRFGIETLR